jgi:tRNA 5-methylaminomethyl-2-thiouridine biosynthesis bifunctional protein
MIRDNAPWRPLPTADLEWIEGDTPRSRHYGDIYFSPADGVAESRHVFLVGSGLPARWRSHADRAFRIGELGFGSGLNFLLTRQAFVRQAPSQLRLHYWAVECCPMARDDLRRCSARWPGLGDGAGELLARYPPPVPGVHRLLFDDGRVVLDLCWADAEAALADLASHGRPWFDAWYLDGFAPRRNEAMWQPGLWLSLAGASRSGATVATFSAAGHVRRGLEAAGFAVARRPGFGHKRECLSGVLTGRPAAAGPAQTPWDLAAAPAAAAPRSAVVIGAGIAGCSAAAALARRGVAVTVVDAGDVAGRGSGNAQGVLYTRLSHRHSAVVDWSLLAYLYAHRHYDSLFSSGALVRGRDGALCGCFQLEGPQMDLDALTRALAAVPELAEPMTADAAAQQLGLRPAGGGLWLPHSGWLHPPAACRALLDRPGIELREHCGPVQLRPDGAGWRAAGGRGLALQADIAVVAAGVGSSALSGLDWLPLRVIRGQTTELPAPALPGVLRAAFCHEGYAAPPRGDSYCVGASFLPGDSARELRSAEHAGNIAALGRALPDWDGALRALCPETLRGRAELRCASPDYLPAAGAVPESQAFRERYRELARNARRLIPLRAPLIPGLYLSTAHGSRGLTSAPLAAEIIASAACDEPPPLPRALLRALAPARFLVRALVRGAA